MSVQAISWVIDNSESKGNALVVLLMVANHTKSDGTGAWPSVSTLAKECRMSERTVQRCIGTLIKIGELKVRFKQGPYKTNLYELPGVKLSPRGAKGGEGWCQPVQGVVTAVSPNPSLSVLEDKERWSILERSIKETEQDKRKNKPSAQERYDKYIREAIHKKKESHIEGNVSAVMA